MNYNEHPLNKRFDLDSLFGSIWEFYKKWFVSLFTISFILSLMTSLISSTFDISGLSQTTDPYEMLESMRSMVGPYFLIILVSMIASMLIQYWVIRKPVDQDGNFISYIGTVLVKYFLPLLVLYIVFGIISVVLMILGLVVLIVGIFFSAVYVILLIALLTPVLMIEEDGIGGTFTQTFNLAHKRFWPNMGWTAIFVLILVVVSMVLGAIVMIPFSGGFIKTLVNPEAASELLNFAKRPSFILLSAVTNAVTMPLLPIFGVALYFNAKSYEDGSVAVVEDENKPSVEDLAP